MNDQTDPQLLRAYADRRSDPAFAELVRRHLDHVHSAALRMVNDSHLAQDVTQGVFVALAKNAGQLTDRAVLSGWLHRTAQNIAAQTVRTDVRRRAREQEAAAMNELLAHDPGTDWKDIAPHLDAALGELPEPDRDALMLRYFERKTAREMAQTLGISDEAAQKRVSRAVEHLRELFAKRGVTAGATGLAVLLTANAVQAAPVGLAVTISAAATLTAATLTTTATATAVKTIAMTTLQKTLVTATVAVLAGAGIYEARQASQLREQVQTLQQQHGPLAEQLKKLESERVEMAGQLASLRDEADRNKSNNVELLRLRGEVTRLRSDVGEQNDPVQIAAKAWVNRVSLLKERLAKTPEANIPEMKLLDEEDWLAAVKFRNLDTDVDYRRAMSTLRNAGESKVAPDLQKALTEYLKNNGKQFPTDLALLKPYLPASIDDAILQHWAIVPAKAIESVSVGGDWAITQQSVVDDVFDSQFSIGPDGFGSGDYLSHSTRNLMDPVYDAYRAAHGGNWPTDLTTLMPYVTTPEQRSALQKLMLKDSTKR